MSKEIIEEYDISEFEVISAKEDQEGYRMKSTFYNRKLQKIQNLSFDLKAPREGLLLCSMLSVIHTSPKKSFTIYLTKGSTPSNILLSKAIVV